MKAEVENPDSELQPSLMRRREEEEIQEIKLSMLVLRAELKLQSLSKKSTRRTSRKWNSILGSTTWMTSNFSCHIPNASRLVFDHDPFSSSSVTIKPSFNSHHRSPINHKIKCNALDHSLVYINSRKQEQSPNSTFEINPLHVLSSPFIHLLTPKASNQIYDSMKSSSQESELKNGTCQKLILSLKQRLSFQIKSVLQSPALL